MTKAKHTPGPWVVVFERDAAEPAICTNDETYVASAHVGMKDWDDVSKANAHLIAAAPDLLEALCEVLDLEDNTSPFGGELQEDRVERTIEKARAAIAKAKGEA